jgi:hypothetical protein
MTEFDERCCEIEFDQWFLRNLYYKAFLICVKAYFLDFVVPFLVLFIEY